MSSATFLTQPSSCIPARLSLLLPFLLLLVSLLLFLLTRTQIPTLLTAKSAAQTFPPDHCHIYAAPRAPPVWRFNSRALCLSSHLCLTPSTPHDNYLHASDFAQTRCTLSSPTFTPVNNQSLLQQQFRSCQQAQQQLVTCAHGPGLKANKPQCPPTVDSLRDVDLHNSAHHPRRHTPANTKWLEHVSILVPSYPYPANIYHYGNAIASIAHVASHLPRLLSSWGLANLRAADTATPYFPDTATGTTTTNPKISHINILFTGTPNQNAWQLSLLDILINHRIAKTTNATVSTSFIRDYDQFHHLCLRNAVVLGRRGHINVWFFPNGTHIPLDGTGVPADAVQFKRAFYEVFDIQARLPDPDNMISELPPLVLGYAQRLAAYEAQGGNVHLTGTKRRFDEVDEKWFVDMLTEETKQAGVKLHIFKTSADDPLHDQVTNIAKVGFVVGIHGANLVNSIFMHPFGALLEILPANADSPCYIGAANSGLAYYRHTSTEEATPEESGCDPEDKVCQTKARQRLVKIGSKEDRDGIRAHVRAGLNHLRYLHDTFPDGIPVSYDEDADFFNVMTTTNK